MIALAISVLQTSLPFLSPMFGDHMVMQRDKPNVFWGWTTPAAQVTVSVGGHQGSATADENGKWMARVDPPEVGGPYVVSVDGPQHVRLQDVLCGDVWVCSGQSNMEFGMGLLNNPQQEIQAANYPDIRLYLTQHAINFQPLPLPVGNWAPCTPDNISQNGWSGFTAVGYFFGRELHNRLHIPIGLVETSWGGTVAESWTSRASLESMHDFDGALKQIDDSIKAGIEPLDQRLDKWFAKNDRGTTADWQIPTLDDSSWKTAAFPFTYEANGLDKFDGVVWCRATLNLPDPLPSGDAVLSLGAIDDFDATWVNGLKVGQMFVYNGFRKYAIPAGVLRPGANVIAIRVTDTGGPGGFTTPVQQIGIKFGDGPLMPLPSQCKFLATADLTKSDPIPTSMQDNPNVPTVLNNGMIHPLQPLAIKGAIWYQGESNVGRAEQYHRLLPTMIADWRKAWGEGDFPFYIVQLANFADRHPQPLHDEPWAELRESQDWTAKHVKNAGLAVAIDIGDGADIHPKDKQDVGLRLALAALHGAYGQKVEFSGPTYRLRKRVGHTLLVSFEHADGLFGKDGKVLGFQIAGADHVFHWADGAVQGSAVIVSSPDVPEPVDVRYAWDANPEATLYNSAHLPAEPFRSDRPAWWK